MANGRVPGPIGRYRSGDEDAHGHVSTPWSLGLALWHAGRQSPQPCFPDWVTVRRQHPLFLHSNMLGEPLDYDRLYQSIARWEGVIRHMYLDTHQPPLVTVGAGNMLQDVGAAQALPFIDAATNHAATREQIAHAFRSVAAKPGGHPSKFYLLRPSIELPEAKVKELAVNRLKVEFIPKIKKLYPEFDFFPLPAREALIDVAYNAGVGSPERVVHGKTHKATGLYKFRRLKTAIDAGDWTTAALSCHRSSSRPERNEWTRKLFERAASLAALEAGPSRYLHIQGGHLKPPVF
jgi:GH24 family phage-related lysozyme (muramidase)